MSLFMYVVEGEVPFCGSGFSRDCSRSNHSRLKPLPQANSHYRSDRSSWFS